MKLEEVSFDSAVDSKRKAVEGNLGREVIVKDTSFNWYHGYLEEDPSDSDFYKIRTEEGPVYQGYELLHTLLLVNR
jgi:hypothetical protein